jgi:hypothetical protein
MKRTIFTALLLGSILAASANDVYVSATGNDTNDGLSSASAFATFGKALTAVEDGGTVHVSGFLYTCDDDANPVGDVWKSGYIITKNVTVQGTNKATDGFIGYNDLSWNGGRFFMVNNGGVLTLKNLALKDGLCTDRSGGIFVNGGTLTAEDVIFENCESATSGSDPARGGAIEVERTLGLTFKRCLFKNNKAPKGGAFYIQDTGNPNVEIRFEACSFVGNTSSQGGASCGGLFFRLMAENLTINILNSTFSNNVNAASGGVVYIYGAAASNTFNIVNCTIVDNIGLSTGSGSSAGIKVEDNSAERRPLLNIQNSIIEGNAIASGATAEDLVFMNEPSTDKLRISNSFIGNVYVAGAVIVPADCYAESALYWNYMSRTFDRSEVLSGIDAFNGDHNVYPLLANAPALNYGQAAFLQNIGIATDQLGTTRTFADGKCSAGAMEGVGMPPSGFHPAQWPENLKVYQSGENLLIQSADAKTIRVQLFTLSGQAVAIKTAAGEVTIPLSGQKGIYVAKISVADKIYAQKVILK